MQKYRILRINCVGAIANLYFSNFNLNNKNYLEQLKILVEENLIHPGSWSKIFDKLNVCSFDIVPNLESLQRKWLQTYYPEMKYNYIKTVFKQIEHYKPDVVFIYAGAFINSFPKFMREDLKSKFPFIKIVTGMWGDHLIGSNYKDSFSDLDFVFTNCKLTKEKFENDGMKAYHLGNAFDPFIINDHHKYINTKIEKKYDVIFSGDTGYGKFDHIERYFLLKYLMKKIDLIIFANEIENKSSFFLEIKNYARINLIRTLSKLHTNTISKINSFTDNYKLKRILNEAVLCKTDDTFLVNYFKGERPLKQMYPDRVKNLAFSIKDYYDNVKSSSIVLNIHREDPADIANIRVFEVTGLNSFLLTDKASELSDYFKENEHFVGYKNKEDCINKIKYFLKNKSEREEIARNASEYCLKNHTVKNRCESIDEILRKELF